MHSPNYFLLIPAHVVDDERIDDATAILFGRLASLSNKYGYSWASDKYLAELTRVCERTICNRLKTLENCGYIRRETTKKGMHWERKLYPNFNYEEKPDSPRTETGFPSERNPVAEEQDNVYKYKNNNREVQKNQKLKTPTNLKKSVVVSLSKLNLSNLEKENLQKEHPEKIEKLVERVLKWKDRSNDLRAVRTILSRWENWCDNQETSEDLENIKKQELEEKRQKRYERAEKIKQQDTDANFTLRSNYIEIKTKKGYCMLSLLENHVDSFLDRWRLNFA